MGPGSVHVSKPGSSFKGTMRGFRQTSARALTWGRLHPDLESGDLNADL